MAVAFDATATGKVLNATSVTFAHTCTGSNLVLVVGSSTDSNVDTTNITYAGVALTGISEVMSPLSTLRVEQWGKIAPATGANNVIITAAAATGIVGGSSSFTGADQTTGWGTVVTANGSTATPSVNVASASGEMVVDCMGNGVDASDLPTATVGAGQTQRWNDDNNNKNRGCGSTEAGAATVTMSWALSVAEQWAISGVSIKAAAGAAFIAKKFIYNQAVRRASFY